MTSLLTTCTHFERFHRRGKRARSTLAVIPEDRSCREWSVPMPQTSSPMKKPPRHNSRTDDDAETAVCYKLIDIERQDNNLHALVRSEELHQLAQIHAARMAEACQVSHSVSNLAELQELLDSHLVGENVHGGTSAGLIHLVTMKKMQTNRNNILNSDFHFYGVGASRGRDGKLYVCHYFR